VGEVLVEGGPRRHAGFLEFDHHPGQAIDEADQIGPAGVERAGHAELADQQESRCSPGVPNRPRAGVRSSAAVFAVGHRHRDAFLEQPIDLAVGGFQAHRRAVAGQFVDGVESPPAAIWVEFAQRRAQAFDQHHLALGLAPQRTARAEGFFHRRHRLPAERGKQPDGGLLDELVFGVGVGHSSREIDC
jgi:hypothetical protein